jgi:hypothetical protein
MKLVLVDSMDQVLDAALRRKPKALTIEEPPTVVKPDDKLPEHPERQDRVRRTPFPPADQPPVVVNPR